MTVISDIYKPRQGGSSLASRIDMSGDCWEWMGTKMVGGYGKARHNNQYTTAHRVIWMCLVGPIPEGMELDHLCHNRACVKPAHLEPVTPLENHRRARLANLPPPYCPQGHDFTPENTGISSRGSRFCRQCQRDRAQKNYWKNVDRNRERACEYQRRKRDEAQSA